MMVIDSAITKETREAQRRIFRLAQHDYGLTRKNLSADSGIPYGTLSTYASGEAIMPVTAVIRLAGIIPDQLLSELFAPADRQLVATSDDDSDLDDLGECAGEIEREVRKARHPKSPGGTEIVAIEEAAIRRCAQRLRVA